MKHLLSLNDLTTEEIEQILTLAAKLKKDLKNGVENKILKGKTLGMIFAKSSTRTRVSFEVGMYQLGGTALYLNANDIQLGRGEIIYDTANVLSRYLDGIMIRTFKQSDVEDLAKYGSIPVINGLTDLFHPCQILADLQTIQEQKGRLQGLKLAYVGDGFNIANSLLHGCAKVGMNIAIATPKGYECDAKIVEEAKATAKLTGSKITVTNDPELAFYNADVMYTDTWISMGQEDEKESRMKAFIPYQVNAKLVSKAKDNAIFLHDLPAYRDFEVTAEIIDGPNSFIFDQAENRMHAQKAVMALLMGKDN
ncbi:MAG TPA: ornithine carbamoyltransferase [Clostridia bacterium]|nr:ornithine carbamoyltransferase [Clostridia bacterium]